MKELMGLAFLVWPLALMLGFVLVFSLAVSGTWFATRKQKSGWKWPLGVAALLYLVVFWDHIPTVLAHKHYCDAEAGFWVYKTVDQWKAENLGVMETLVSTNKSSSETHANWPHERKPDMDIARINQRFGIAYKNHLSSREEGELFLNTWRWKSELLDIKTGEILARQVDFSTGNGYIGGPNVPLKFWLQREHCSDGQNQSQKFWEFIKPFKGATQ